MYFYLNSIALGDTEFRFKCFNFILHVNHFIGDIKVSSWDDFFHGLHISCLFGINYPS